MPRANYDLLVIGGGINGAGIARDAAGRGLSVLLVEARDLAAATSSASSKLIHGGLRYLEHFEFRLVAEALAEREVLLHTAGHLVRPMRFVVPHVPQLRSRTAIRLGLFLYDHLARRSILPGSRALRLDLPPYRGMLRPDLRRGFAYWDCRVDDARLVVVNAFDAAARGARILPRTECRKARRANGLWHVELSNGEELSARAIANVAGPWVKRVLTDRLGEASREPLRLVQGSHIVLPRLYEGQHAFLLQNDDRRVVFMIPFEERFTLVGTTEVPFDSDASCVRASDAEVDYLCRALRRYLPQPVDPADIRWRYAGVRPLHAGGGPPSAMSRDYAFSMQGGYGDAPVLSVFGGKITTYRRLAEHAMDRLKEHFPGMKPAWTALAPLPGSGFEDRERAHAALVQRYRDVPREILDGVFARHGTLAEKVLGDGAFGEHYGAGLTECEVRYFVRHEWAACADDVLWRRTKTGLSLSSDQQARLAEAIAAISSRPYAS